MYKRINELIIEYNNRKNVNNSPIIQIDVNDSIENIILEYVIDILNQLSIKRKNTKKKTKRATNVRALAILRD